MKNFGLAIDKETAAYLFLVESIPVNRIADLVSNQKKSVNKEMLGQKARKLLKNSSQDIKQALHNRYQEWKETFGEFTNEELTYLYKMGVPQNALQDPSTQLAFNSAMELANHVKQFVKGQDAAIEMFAVPFFQHYLSKMMNYNLPFKTPSLIMGPTGVGKSEIIRRMCDAIRCKNIRITTTDISPNTYKGASIGQAIASTLGNVEDVSELKYAVLAFHEFDKLINKGSITTTSNGTDFSIEMQREFMRLIETDHPLRVEYGFKDKGEPNIVNIPTQDMLIVFDGCFSNMSDIINKRLNPNHRISVGFNKLPNNQADHAVADLSQVTSDDLITYGFMPELVGRIAGNIAVANPLSVDHIYNIICNAKDNMLSAHIDYCAKCYNTELYMEEEAIRYIAEIAFLSGLGCRNVKNILSNILNRFYFTLIPNQEKEMKRVNITKQYVMNQLNR
jgi:ATP-dependent Clp protease ATP-binding subunit ClpX